MKKENNWLKDLNIEEIICLLPKEYQQVEYIESTGTQYIDTKFKPNQNTSIQTHIYRTERNKTWQFPFDSRNSAGTNEFEMCFYMQGGGWRDDYGNTEDRIFFNYDKELGDFFIDKDRNSCEINGIVISHSEEIEIKCDYNFTIFGVNYQGGVRAYESDMIKLYYFKIYNNGVLIRNYIPCYCKISLLDVDGKQCEQGTIGLYDLVEGKFYTNQGTGDFIKGPDVD